MKQSRCVFLLLCILMPCVTAYPDAQSVRLEGLREAPDFPQNLQWLNTAAPISLKDYRGKVVLLDFWTYCCINCMHVIPDLKKLEAKYPKELVVIGVHSAKFKSEKENENIRQAILRYGIEHPVINDNQFMVWDSYAVTSWPTLVLISPDGKIIQARSGEGVFEAFDPLIQQVIRHFDAKGAISREAVHLKLEKEGEAKTFLSFPGKIFADAKERRLFISDSNHHRILIADFSGKVMDQIASGERGALNGSFQSATLNNPQGMVLYGEQLYIADTDNHLIRRADLKTRTLKTVLGNGKQARGKPQKGKATRLAISSPWDLLIFQNKMYIAMAGLHQIWKSDLKHFAAHPYAGSGQEGRVDGLLLDALLAQPSGLTTDGNQLFFADSENSSVRSASFDGAGKVETLIGEGLFEFGDIDGFQSKARLQHPLAVVYHEGKVFVADTYNSKIKVIDPKERISVTFAGNGRHGRVDGTRLEAQFDEPGGISVAEDILYVADTNNHQIRLINLNTDLVSTLNIQDDRR